MRDHAHALIDVEMDSDFELECQDIANNRREKGEQADADLPDFIYTATNLCKYLKQYDFRSAPPCSLDKLTNVGITPSQKEL